MSATAGPRFAGAGILLPFDELFGSPLGAAPAPGGMFDFDPMAPHGGGAEAARPLPPAPATGADAAPASAGGFFDVDPMAPHGGGAEAARPMAPAPATVVAPDAAVDNRSTAERFLGLSGGDALPAPGADGEVTIGGVRMPGATAALLAAALRAGPADARAMSLAIVQAPDLGPHAKAALIRVIERNVMGGFLRPDMNREKGDRRVSRLLHGLGVTKLDESQDIGPAVVFDQGDDRVGAEIGRLRDGLDADLRALWGQGSDALEPLVPRLRRAYPDDEDFEDVMGLVRSAAGGNTQGALHLAPDEALLGEYEKWKPRLNFARVRNMLRRVTEEAVPSAEDVGRPSTSSSKLGRMTGKRKRKGGRQSGSRFNFRETLGIAAEVAVNPDPDIQGITRAVDDEIQKFEDLAREMKRRGLLKTP